MKKIKTIVVEDQWIVSEEITQFLQLNDIEVIGQAEDASTALDLMSAMPADVALLDINLKGKTDGIELANELVEKYDCAIIFLTASADRELVKRAKLVNPAAYIVKPFEETNLLVAVEMAFNNLLARKSANVESSYVVSDYVFIKDQDRFKRVAIDQIDYVAAQGSYITIFSESAKYTLAINLKAFEQSLGDSPFLRIHRSYIVNVNKVEEYVGNQVLLGSRWLPISSTYKENFVRHFRFL